MENYSRYALEHAFANDFKSPLFPVLANLYYENQELQRALKVCKIGLKNDPNNYIGQYILSKTYINLIFLSLQSIIKIAKQLNIKPNKPA